MSGKLVLVSGASGYIAAHVIQQLLEEGYRVRGTVRSLKDPQKYAALYELHPKGKENLELVEAELQDVASWVKAVKTVDYICHIASPVPLTSPENEDEVIMPARNGTLNVLQAAAKEKSVKRVVVTSSIAAIIEPAGYKYTKDESNWANPADNPSIAPYNKSKTVAERAAWAFYESLPSDSRFELCTVNPSLVFGPVLLPSSGTSLYFAKALLEKTIPYIIPVAYPIVDVRDVAKAHIVCLTSPQAAGHRHVLLNRSAWVKEICEVFRKEFAPQGYDIASEDISPQMFEQLCAENNAINRARCFWSEALRLDNTRFKEVLGINPIPLEKTLVDTAYSFIEFGITKKTAEYKGPNQD